ncbi:unnamed protein product [Periconia digitata]|uniref:Uncharacterized protein n=1 Tax=Periconia digitata TaxID=1303443 RepID=A0A9W4U1D4_9PLEO|nr:unnamed protein product [Periconia digitata]
MRGTLAPTNPSPTTHNLYPIIHPSPLLSNSKSHGHKPTQTHLAVFHQSRNK